ncbi:MAG: tetratricopeptide repeat protein [Casimicrobiaceae bacterium]
MLSVTPPSSRNAQCPCGSGKRYKDCHGALAPSPPAATMIDGAAVARPTDSPASPSAQSADEHSLQQLRAALACGDTALAERLWQQILVAEPDQAEANFHAGNALRERGETRAAVARYEHALRAAPGNAATLNNLGLALEAMGEPERAFECYGAVLATDPAQPDALGNIGNALYEKQDYRGAVSAYSRLVAIRRELPVATVVRRGTALKEIGRLVEAEACFVEAARRAPDDVRILAKLGPLYVDQKRYADAELPLARAHALDPDNGYVLSLLAHARMQRCAWEGIDGLFHEIARIVEVPPHEYWKIAQLQLLAMPLSPQTLRRAATQWGTSIAPDPLPFAPSVVPSPDGRLRVGFVSSDFRLHPMATVITEVLERIDRSRLEVFAYGLLPPDAGPAGRRIAAAVEHSIDLSELDDNAAVRRIRADGIAVAFDLNGYTGNSRPALFARRAAPLQVNSIGFPGTLGVEWYDYVHVDPFVVPADAECNYAERPLRMPYSYYASDTTRAPAGPAPSRAACGLPDDAFVFSCFNNSFKILPKVFHAWMRILDAVPGSVLWLLATNADARTNLRNAAANSGVAPERLVFAPRVDVAGHIARNAAADLFLDTTPYGAHTTANDALLAGLPVLTIAGDTFASRVAGSQLHAIGLPELVTASLAEYEALAIALARDRSRLAQLRERLARNRCTYPLFDMARYARDLEDGLLAIWQRHVAEARGASR